MKMTFQPKKAFPFQGSRFQSQNEYSRWKKSFSSKTCKRKKEIIRIGHSNVTFFLLTFTVGGVHAVFGIIKK